MTPLKQPGQKHVEFQVTVALDGRQWAVKKRYSEFRQVYASSGLSVEFPSKEALTFLSGLQLSDAQLENRRHGLQNFISKLAESKPYNQNIGYMDRLDYVSMMCNEHAYVLAIEDIMKLDIPERSKYIRVMFDEITRILNHLLWLGAHALDIGAMSVFLYAFREREDLMDCYEAVSGTRMHATYYRPGGVAKDLPNIMPKYMLNKNQNLDQVEKLNYNREGSLLDFIDSFIDRFPKNIDEYENLLTDNRIWKQRTVGIGVVSPDRAIDLGFTGPMLRGSGVEWDLRKKEPYEIYKNLEFDIPVGTEGDSYDRYLVRMQEMRESAKIIKQCCDWLKNDNGDFISSNNKIAPPDRDDMKENMESLIHHFKLFSEGYCLPVGETYKCVEAPKGEFGIYLISDGANKPYRLKIREIKHLTGKKFKKMLKFKGFF